VKMHFQRKVGIFACDEPGVYSNQVIHVGPGVDSNVVASDLKCNVGGEFKTALNTDIFIAVWKRVVVDGRFTQHDWTVKVDPDTVFFASRLKSHLSSQKPGDPPGGAYINNCKFGMHGPLEVFTKNAVHNWIMGISHCVAHFTRLCSGPCLWGEDMFMDQCFQRVLGVQRENDYAMLNEAACDPKPGWDSCNDVSYVAYHPFKTLEGWQACLTNSESVQR